MSELQDIMLEMDQVDIVTAHKFCNGVYAREIEIPAGVCLSGAKHKTEFFMVISKGKCIVVDGDERKELEAPSTTISEVGAKRLIYAIKDTVLTTFHPTTETNIEKIENDIIEPEGLRISNNPRRVLKSLG